MSLRETLRGTHYTFQTTWGLFSPLEVDAGSRLLIESMEIQPGDMVLDLGCGYGAIGLVAAHMSAPGTVHMTDKDFVAIEYARKNAEANGIRNVEIYLSNGFDQVPAGHLFDVIVSNPPAKINREYFLILLYDAKAHLTPGGRLSIVTIAGLSEFVKRSLKGTFGNYKKIKQRGTYRVLSAINNRAD